MRAGAPAKSLLLAPERLAVALIEDGWTIRNKVIWAKTNPMPASVRDRLSCTWEVVYFLVRSPDYHFDLDAVRMPHRSANRGHPTGNPKAVYPPASAGPPSWAGPLAGSNSGLAKLKARGLAGHPLGKNPGDVWTMATANFRGEHFAVFPTGLVRTPLLATCPERTCTRCGLPWRRQPVRRRGHLTQLGELRPACRCRAGYAPGVVLDPFFGSGTVGVVAEAHGRDWIAVELNPAFARLAEGRIAAARAARLSGKEQNRAAA
jgi:site-specific DNA-methyltransferase (adenine-specific)